jgi:nucleoside-diphosphate kinase
MMQLDDAIINEHYDFLMDKPFFPMLKEYMTSCPVVALAVSGENAISVVRTVAGATNPQEAQPGTIRGDFGMTIDANIMHASDSEDTAKVELQRFFKGQDVFEYSKISDDTL